MSLGPGFVALALLVAGGAARAEWVGGANTEVPLDGNGATWLVHATLNGSVSGLFLIDTGASLCVVGPGTARRLNVSPTGEEVQLQTANGTVRAPVIRVRT